MNNRGAAGAADERVGNEVVTQRKRVKRNLLYRVRK